MKDDSAFKRVWYFDNKHTSEQDDGVNEGASLGFTKQQVDTFKIAFKLFDEDGDNTISTREIGNIMRSIGLDPSEE